MLTGRGLLFAGRRLACVAGRGGISTAKREGDGATPAGAHGIIACLYRPDRIARPVPWAVAIRPRDLWSDDPRDRDYNLMVRAPHPHSAERLFRPDPLYDLLLVTDYNWPRAVRGAGSAIFIHLWRGPARPTAGCVALARRDLSWMVRRLRPGARLIVPAQP